VVVITVLKLLRHLGSVQDVRRQAEGIDYRAERGWQYNEGAKWPPVDQRGRD